jgi:protein gp37
MTTTRGLTTRTNTNPLRTTTETIYGVADRAWQVVVGCDPSMQCAPRCWARKTVARIVKCQEGQHPERAAFFQIALTGDGERWSGKTFLDPVRLNDPLKWKKPALIATGFHGDWGRLERADMLRIFDVIRQCPQHDFMLLSKMPAAVFTFLSSPAFGTLRLQNVTIGCSVMNQVEADQYRAQMACISALGWRTHVWYEPAIGPVDWEGWEFIERIIVGGETSNAGYLARRFDVQWAHNTLAWCRRSGVKFWMKQLGHVPVTSNSSEGTVLLGNICGGRGVFSIPTSDRKGEALQDFPEGLRVREAVVNA